MHSTYYACREGQHWSDPSIRELWEVASTVAEVKDRAHGYFLDYGVLVRKWVPCYEVGVQHPLFQVVVLAKLGGLVLQVSLNKSGYQGVRKTYDCTLSLTVLVHCFLQGLEPSICLPSCVKLQGIQLHIPCGQLQPGRWLEHFHNLFSSLASPWLSKVARGKTFLPRCLLKS